ncbi:MAG TPA: peptidylprolyl isomerase [Caldisericia bacterium]|nr:peptidylprolyl isomerase [Caldisericia bacterium]
MRKIINSVIVVVLLSFTFSINSYTQATSTQPIEKDTSFYGEIYQLTEIVDVIDGDTIEIPILDERWLSEENKDKESIKVRLMGINCFDKWDQATWIQARESAIYYFTEERKLNKEKGENIKLIEEDGFYMKVVKRDDNDRLLAYITTFFQNFHPEVTPVEVNNENFFYGIDLSHYQVFHGYAVPTVNFCINDGSKEDLERMREYVDTAIATYKHLPSRDTSIWCADKLSDEIDIEIDPYDKSDKSHLTNGNHITIKWSDEPTLEYINLAGYSVIDENASQLHRFFLPDVSLGKHTSNISMWFGDPKTYPTDWLMRNDADDGYEIYTLTETLVTMDKDNPESIFLRDPNRKIVDWVFWNGEETVSPDKIIDHLSMLIDNLSENSEDKEEDEETKEVNDVIVFETNHGSFEVNLWTDKAPIACNNMITKVKDGFYDGLTFHRVVKGFVIQGGCPDGTGKGGGFMDVDPKFDESSNIRGRIAMASNSRVQPISYQSDSQFYINLGDNSYLDKLGFIAFGEVINGMDVIDEISEVETEFGPYNEKSLPIEDVIIKKAILKKSE